MAAEEEAPNLQYTDTEYTVCVYKLHFQNRF